MKRFFILMTVLVALMTGCDPQTGTGAGNGSGTGNNTSSDGAAGTAAAELVSMDITDAESIYISTPTEAGETVSAKAGVTARTIGERAAARGFAGSVLFKITKEGKAVEISLTWGNDKNENTSQLRPVAVHEAGPDYVITEFYKPTIRQTIAYLINKKSGKAYSLEEVGVPQRFGDPHTRYPLIYTDENKNIYYKTILPYARNGKSYDLVKVDVSRPGLVSTELMTLPQDYFEVFGESYGNLITGFIVDKQGNVIYDRVGEFGFSVRNGGRVLFQNGGMTSIDQSTEKMWVGLDGCIYGYKVEAESGSSCMYKYRFEAQSRKVVAEKIDTDIVSDGSYSLKVGDELLHIDRTGYTVVYNENMKLCRSKSFSEIKIEIDALAASDTCYYISGRNLLVDNRKEVVFKIDPRGEGSCELISGFEGYAVYQLAYSNGFLTFGGICTENRQPVIGKFDVVSGKVVKVEETTTGNVTYLTPIN